MKKLLAILLLVPGYAMAVCNPFIANTVLTASALNSAIANPCITGGTVVGVSIDNSPIGQSSPATIYITNASIAAAGTTQGTAAPLTAQSNKVISASGAANGVILPTPLRSGFFIEVDNDTAVTIYIYPAAGAQIDVNGTNVPDAIPSGGSVMYTSSSTSQWDSYLSQNQNFATINAASGVNATGAYTAPYTDGTVVDYTTGNGRISVGVGDTLTMYASGVANTQMEQLSTTGTTVNGLKYGTSGAGKLAVSVTAPTIASGFGTGAAITANNGTASFNINVGTGGTASSGVVTMPSSTIGWNCIVTPASGSPQAGAITLSAASSTTSITISNYTLSTGAALAWGASTLLSVMCIGY